MKNRSRAQTRENVEKQQAGDEISACSSMVSISFVFTLSHLLTPIADLEFYLGVAGTLARSYG